MWVHKQSWVITEDIKFSVNGAIIIVSIIVITIVKLPYMVELMSHYSERSMSHILK